MKLRLTKKLVDALEPTELEFVVWDSELTGFGVRVRPSGHMTYIVQYRAGSGRGSSSKKITVGPVNKLTADEARALAKKNIAEVLAGHDPAQQKADMRKAKTLAEILDGFVENTRDLRKHSTYILYEGVVRLHIKPWFGTKRAVDVSTEDVTKFHRSFAASKITANRAVNILGAAFNWAATVKSYNLPMGLNPTKGVTRYPEEGRERYLTQDEYVRLGEVLEQAETVGLLWEPDPNGKTKHAPKETNRYVKIDPFVVAAVRLFLLTGARLREILHARWSDYDKFRGVLFVPNSKTGKKTIVLSGAAMAVLDALPMAGAYIIPGASPNKPRHDLKRPWYRIRKHAGLEDVRLHDLRHTFASEAVGNGFGLPIIGKLLGHSQVRTTQRYAHLDTGPQRRVADAIGERITAAMARGADSGTFSLATSDDDEPRR